MTWIALKGGPFDGVRDVPPSLILDQLRLAVPSQPEVLPPPYDDEQIRSIGEKPQIAVYRRVVIRDDQGRVRDSYYEFERTMG